MVGSYASISENVDILLNKLKLKLENPYMQYYYEPSVKTQRSRLSISSNGSSKYSERLQMKMAKANASRVRLEYLEEENRLKQDQAKIAKKEKYFLWQR